MMYGGPPQEGRLNAPPVPLHQQYIYQQQANQRGGGQSLDGMSMGQNSNFGG